MKHVADDVHGHDLGRHIFDLLRQQDEQGCCQVVFELLQQIRIGRDKAHLQQSFDDVHVQ